MTATPKPGDTVTSTYGGHTVEVLDVETIPPEETADPDTPRWAMTVRIIEGDRHYPTGSEHYWPGMGPGDFRVVS